MQQTPATSTPPRVHQPAWVRWCGVVPLLRHPSRRLRRTVLALVALAALGGTGFALGSGLTINLTSSGPQPATASAALGDTVTFVNQDSAPHAIIASGVGLTTPALTTGQPFPYVLTKSGTLNYRQTGEKNFQGEIDVQRSGEVTLGSEVRIVSIPFGASATLVGRTSLPAFPVIIQRKLSGDATWADLATVTPAADGSFSTTVQPPKSGQYRANVLQGQLLSKPVPLPVRPVVTLEASRSSAQVGKPIVLAVRAVPPTAMTSVAVQRYNPRRARWQKLMARPTTDGRATFVWRVEQGRSRLRASLDKRDLQPGFAPSISRQVLVTGSNVETRVTLQASESTAPAGSSVLLTARVAPGAAAKSVTLFRFNPRRGRWQDEMVRRVSAGKATFRWQVEKGSTRLRAGLERQDLRIGFAPSFSRQIVVTGIAERATKTRKRKRQR